MGEDLYSVINIVLSSLILGILLSDRATTHLSQGKPSPRNSRSSKDERKPIAITDEMALDQEIQERENQAIRE